MKIKGTGKAIKINKASNKPEKEAGVNIKGEKKSKNNMLVSKQSKREVKQMISSSKPLPSILNKFIDHYPPGPSTSGGIGRVPLKPNPAPGTKQTIFNLT